MEQIFHEIKIKTKGQGFYDFTDRTVKWVNDQKINMRVWERGVGLTLACGSGACASVYAGQLKKLLGNDVEVQLERGSLFITIDKEEAIMTGLAEISFRGNIEV